MHRGLHVGHGNRTRDHRGALRKEQDMNEVALESIKQIGDELAILREEMRAAKKIIAEREAELSNLQENADMAERSTSYWFKEWQKLRQRCIDGGIMDENEVREDGLPF